MLRIMVAGVVIGTTIGVGRLAGTALAADLGRRPDEAAKPLPGDDLVPVHERRARRAGITIDAPPEAVWPWLVQMGYGRAAGTATTSST